jgi:hypothetical protein
MHPAHKKMLGSTSQADLLKHMDEPEKPLDRNTVPPAGASPQTRGDRPRAAPHVDNARLRWGQRRNASRWHSDSHASELGHSPTELSSNLGTGKLGTELATQLHPGEPDAFELQPSARRQGSGKLGPSKPTELGYRLHHELRH